MYGMSAFLFRVDGTFEGGRGDHWFAFSTGPTQADARAALCANKSIPPASVTDGPSLPPNLANFLGMGDGEVWWMGAP